MTTQDPRLLDHVQIPALIVAQGQVRYANPLARDILGGHIINQDLRIAIRDPRAVTLLTSGEAGSTEVEGIAVAGSRWRLTSHAIENGAWLVLLEDLSHKVSIARAHADFVANASHELRTPLAAILGYVETLGDPKAGGDEATRNRFLGIIANEARRMQTLIEDLMSLSRIEAVRHEAPSQPVDMVALAKECIGEFAARGEVVLVTDLEAAIVTGDRGQLAQVLRNLIDNAFKYGKADVPIEIGIERGQTGRIAVTVRDEGEGIAPEHLPRVTERFYRADTGRSRAAGGTGLGLAIVKHVIARHRGWFDIASAPGKGTTATILLPTAIPAAA